MKRKYLIITIFILFINLFLIEDVYGKAYLDVSSNTYSIYVGNSITISLNINELSGRFKVYSSDTSILTGGAEGWCDNNVCENGMSTRIVFKANKIGTAVIKVVPVNVSITTPGEEADFTETRSITINVINKVSKPSVDVNKVYDKNNYLKSLSVEGYELSPKFNKETLEYEVELEPGTELVNINASLESKKAKIKGIGEIKVTEGLNTLKVIATAENGNERTYTIVAKVDEKDPINVKLDKKDFTVVKKKELIGSKNGYDETVVSINSFEIPALYNEVTKVTLVGVKDADGKIMLVSYDSKKGEYSLYKEFSFDLMNLYIHENENSKYDRKNLRINGSDVLGYKLEGVKDYYLLYATNTVTGYEGYYLYDSKENSVQRYNSTMLDKLTEEKDKYLTVVIVLSSVCFLTMLFLLIEVNKFHKKNED